MSYCRFSSMNMMCDVNAGYLAARKLHEAQRALREAARALLSAYSAVAAQHAKELTEATKMVDRWELALRRVAAESADQQEARNR